MPAKRRVPLAFGIATIAVTACAARNPLPLNEHAPYSQTPIIDRGITSKETVLHSFSGPDGAGPAYGVIADKSGTLYGTTIFGGKSKSSAGVVFKLKPRGFNYEESVIYSFRGGLDGYRGLDHKVREVTAIGLKQIFVLDPNGVLLELNFFGD